MIYGCRFRYPARGNQELDERIMRRTDPEYRLTPANPLAAAPLAGSGAHGMPSPAGGSLNNFGADFLRTGPALSRVTPQVFRLYLGLAMFML